MRRYAGQDEIQRAVNLKATGLNVCEVARQIGRPHQTVAGWFYTNGLVERMGITPNVETVVEEVPAERVRVRVPASSVPGAITRVLAVGDAHDSPLIEDKSRFRAMGRFARERGINHVVQIGDFGDFDSVSTHVAADTIEGKLNNPYLKDIDSLNRALDAFNDGLGGMNAIRHVSLGNHERRVYLYENQHPQTEGMLTSKLERAFSDHGWTTSPYGTFYFLNGVGFTHACLNRLGKSYGGKAAERTIALDAVYDIVIGHSHVRNDHRATKIGPQKHVTVLNLGCALPTGYTQKYVYHGQMSGWWYGIYELILRGGQITDANAISMDELMRLHG
jgi:hypothetical protein